MNFEERLSEQIVFSSSIPTCVGGEEQLNRKQIIHLKGKHRQGKITGDANKTKNNKLNIFNNKCQIKQYFFRE